MIISTQVMTVWVLTLFLAFFGGQGLEQTVGREDNHESSGIARTDRV